MTDIYVFPTPRSENLTDLEKAWQSVHDLKQQASGFITELGNAKIHDHFAQTKSVQMGFPQISDRFFRNATILQFYALVDEITQTWPNIKRLNLCVGWDKVSRPELWVSSINEASKKLKERGIEPFISIHADYATYESVFQTRNSLINCEVAFICYPLTGISWATRMSRCYFSSWMNDYFAKLGKWVGGRISLAEIGAPADGMFGKEMQRKVYQAAMQMVPLFLCPWGVHDIAEIYLKANGTHWANHGLMDKNNNSRYVLSKDVLF